MYRLDCYASDQALQTFTLSRDEAEDEDDRGAALELVGALGALCAGWIEPQAASLLVESCDPTSFYLVDHEAPPAQPAWFLRRRQLDPRLFVSPEHEAPREVLVEQIGAAALRAFVEQALAQPAAAPERVVALASLSVDAVAVTLPDDVELALRYPGGPLSAIVTREGSHLRVLGPDAGPVAAPLRLRASNQHGLVRLTLELCWDFWIEQPIGRAQVRAALERVLSRGGWRLEHGELP
jgi:hypothetical protein